MATRTVYIKPSGGDYATLKAALDAQIANYTNLTVDNGSGAAGIVNFEIGGTWSSADTASATTLDLVTSADYYVNIYTDSSNRATASGYKTDRYRLEVSNANALALRTDYIRVDGLQIKKTSISANYQNAIYVQTQAATNNDVRVSNCRLAGTGGDAYVEAGIEDEDDDTILKVWNTIITGFAPGLASTLSGGVYARAATADIYNSVIYNCRNGVRRSSGTCAVKDSAIFECTDDVYGTWTVDYCATDDNDGTNNVDETAGGKTWADTFENAANGDFRLKAGSPLIGAGGMAGSSIFSTDIEGTARGATWDIGAYQFESVVSNIIMNIL